MKIFKVLLISIVSIMLFVGCGAKEAKPTDVSVNSGEGVIIVYRPQNDIWRHKRFNVYLNGEFEDILMSKSHHLFNKKPGEYLIEVREDTDLNPEIFQEKVELNEGKVKYLKFGTKGMDGHLKLKSVMRSVAVAEEWYQKRY